jgi:hypothetical protein
VFDDTLFTAREGEQYLMSALMSSFGDGADLMFLTDAGPYDFSVSPDPETGTFPFTTNCTGEVTDYIAAFHDVTVYADEELTEELCTIAADTILPRDPGMQSGSWAVTLDFSDDNIYGVYLNAFAAQCGNVETGYVNAPETTVHRVTTWLIPIAGFVGPA